MTHRQFYPEVQGVKSRKWAIKVKFALIYVTDSSFLNNVFYARYWRGWLEKINTKLCLLLALLGFVGCQSNVTSDFPRLAEPLDAHKFYGSAHDVMIYSNNLVEPLQSLNIYLEGDGRPWIKRFYINSDPSPLYPLGLDLMTRDAGPAMYVTRPCYNIETDERCRSELWTSARYSPEVVRAMSEAIESELATFENVERITLIGYSGGGTLALLIAQEIERVSRVITVAGSLDTEAWTRLHKYSSLSASINPADVPLRRNVAYIHLLGEKDKNIPPETGVSVYSQFGHRHIVYERYNHSCCWVQDWPEILRELEPMK